jgi:hypothetical protein
MPALVAGIHVFECAKGLKDVDGRDKPGHDAVCGSLAVDRLVAFA